MVSLWPFHSTGGRIQDIKAPQMAEAALQSIQKSGRTAFALRLVYRALELDPFQPHALLILIELFRGKKYGVRPTGDEIYTGILVEYAMDPKSTIAHNQKQLFDKTRSEIMLMWGFVTPKGKDEVDMDHIGYMTYINELMHQVRSVHNGFAIAVAKLGVRAGALDPANYKPTKSYQEWLHSPATSLHS